VAAFVQYIGIDYLGAKTPSPCLKGHRKYWNRHGVAEWLVEQISPDSIAINRQRSEAAFPYIFRTNGKSAS
jgi:hypothetical protein